MCKQIFKQQVLIYKFFMLKVEQNAEKPFLHKTFPYQDIKLLPDVAMQLFLISWLLICKCGHLNESKHFFSLLIWHAKVCVNKMLTRILVMFEQLLWLPISLEMFKSQFPNYLESVC